MKAKILVYALSALILATIQLAEAQQAGKVPQIGYLAINSFSVFSARIAAFRQGLRELGYVEGKPLSLNGALRRENANTFPRSRQSLCVSR